jgi:hypothetical protein
MPQNEFGCAGFDQTFSEGNGHQKKTQSHESGEENSNNCLQLLR